jgi:hypothetical protein
MPHATKTTTLLALAAAIVLASPARSAAQQLTAAPSAPGAPKVYPLVPKPVAALPGWSTIMLQGVADAEGDRFILENLDVLQPVDITLVAKTAEEDLNLGLYKFDFRQPVSEQSTKGAQIALAQTRTQGDLRMKVSSKDGLKPYQLIVWVHEPMEVPPPVLFAAATRGGSAAPAASPAAVRVAEKSSGSLVLWIIAVALMVVVILLVVIVLRRRPGAGSAAVIIAAALAARVDPVSAQGGLKPLPEAISTNGVWDYQKAINEMRKANGAGGYAPPGGGFADPMAVTQSPYKPSNPAAGGSPAPAPPASGGAAPAGGGTIVMNGGGGVPPSSGGASTIGGTGAPPSSGSVPTLPPGPAGPSPSSVAPTLPQGSAPSPSSVSPTLPRPSPSSVAPTVPSGVPPSSNTPTVPTPGMGPSGPSTVKSPGGPLTQPGGVGGIGGPSLPPGGGNGGSQGTAAWQQVFGLNPWVIPAALTAFVQWWKAYQALTPDDAGLWPEYWPPGMPMVPSFCATADAGKPGGAAKAINDPGNGPCGKCFEQAHGDLAKVLQRYEKLRRITKATENMTAFALAFGDGGSAIHGVTALGWHGTIRPQITDAMKNFYRAYDAKLPKLAQALQEALNKIAVCEYQYFNNPDWYNRYGFMFQNTVVERHRR